MRAILCKELGPADKLVIDDIPSPEAGKGQVKVKVKAAGLNFPDTLIIEGKYQIKPELPFSPGGEMAGEVIAVGEGVQRFKPGQRVMGLTGYGAFAEEILVPETNLIPVPDGMDDRTAAAFSMVYGTSYHALKQRANIQPGETLLVLGASGGVGLAAVELGKAMGATVIACASSADKLAVAKEAGADDLLAEPDHVGMHARNLVHDEDAGARAALEDAAGSAFVRELRTRPVGQDLGDFAHLRHLRSREPSRIRAR